MNFFFQGVNHLTLLDRSLIYFTESGRITVHLGNVALDQKLTGS
jgi:hypothetical protein